MTIQLTEKQLAAIDRQNSERVEIVDPLNNSLGYLISGQEFIALQEFLEDEREQHAIRAYAAKIAAKRMI